MDENEPRVIIKPIEELGHETVFAVDLVRNTEIPMVLVRNGKPVAILAPFPNPEMTLPQPLGNNLGLSQRQFEYAEQLALGRNNKQIADALCVSRNTVKFHLRHLFGLLEVRSRTEAALRLREIGLGYFSTSVRVSDPLG